MISPEEFKRITDEVCKKEEIKEQKITEKVVKKALKIISKELKKQAKLNKLSLNETIGQLLEMVLKQQ